MASDKHLTSTLSTEPSDPSETHAQSGLPVAQNSRRTTTGFIVDESRLPGYYPTPPGKKDNSSWVWVHGEAITDHKTSTRRWMCKICYDDPVLSRKPFEKWIREAHPVNYAKRHMASHGYDEAGNKAADNRGKRKHADIRRQFEEQEHTHNQVFDTAGWRDRFIFWVAASGISLRAASSPALFDLLTFGNPKLKPLVPQAHVTVHHMVTNRHRAAKDAVIQSLAHAKSGITISFDHWKANNDILDLLGVVAHYLDREYKPKTVVVALKDALGSHTGDNIAEQLIEVLRDYDICNRVTYFAADNATNNDKALRLLTRNLEIDPVKQRLRCVGHILNLVCKAILYGVDEDCIARVLDEGTPVDLGDASGVTTFEGILRTGDEAGRLEAWRKKGPIGRLHNLVVHIKDNSSRRLFFESKQREAVGDDGARLYRAVLNGGIRWNSTYEMVHRALQLKDALTLYQDHYIANRILDSSDQISPDDWLQLGELHGLLEPIHETSLRVQSQSGIHGATGSLYEALPAMDYVLTKLEAARDALTYMPANHFKACVNLGWKKLDYYYTLTDNSPAYVMAVFLHPHWRRRWFERKWADKPHWLRQVNKTIQTAYDEAKKRHGNIPSVERVSPRQKMSGFDAYNSFDGDEQLDELAMYSQEPPAPKSIDPLAWWVGNQERFPVLRHLAFDLLAAPASTAADERLFSQAGRVVNEERPHMQQELAEALQCIRSWRHEGLI